MSRLLSVAPEVFETTYWGALPLVSRAAELPLAFGDLLDRAGVDELVSRRGLRAPFLRVAKNGATLPDRAFTASGGVGATIADQLSDDKLLRLFADGSTLVLQALHRCWAPILGFSQQLAHELGHPVQANAYVTPPQNTGFSAHYDVHDVFVVQVEGRKRWRIHEPVRRSPLPGEPWTDRCTQVEQAASWPPLFEATLEEGDCLYLPRGYLHAATALGGVSIHVTFGVHTWTRRHITDELVAAALRHASENEALRQSLPVALDLADVETFDRQADLVRAALLEAVAAVPTDELRQLLRARQAEAQRPAPVGVLAQVQAVDELSERHTLVLRSFLAARVVPGTDGSSTLETRAGALALGPGDEAALERLLHRGEAQVADLGLALARRLLLGGIVVAE